MAASREYRTIAARFNDLEVALRSSDSQIVHLLEQKGFITLAVHDEVLTPRLLNDHEKATKLVTGIRNKVELCTSSYHTLLRCLRQGGRHYEGIVRILDKEYNNQEMPSEAPRYHWEDGNNFENGYLSAQVGDSPAVKFTVDPPLHENARHSLKKDGKSATRRFVVRSNSITFTNVRAADSGMYIISCTNARGQVAEEEMELEVIAPTPSTNLTPPVDISQVNGEKEKGQIMATIHDSSGHQGHIVVQGRTLHFKVKSGFHRWQYKHNGTAWDEETGTTVESKGWKSESGARKHALEELVKKLGLVK